MSGSRPTETMRWWTGDTESRFSIWRPPREPLARRSAAVRDACTRASVIRAVPIRFPVPALQHTGS
jgi:hypothetical protein